VQAPLVTPGPTDHRRTGTPASSVADAGWRGELAARGSAPAERSQLFPRFVQMYKGYAGYEHKTSRQIPLVLLTPDHHPDTT
jgi:hypothetical protein